MPKQFTYRIKITAKYIYEFVNLYVNRLEYLNNAWK